MPEENEIQEFFDNLPAMGQYAYHSMSLDGSVAAVGREAVKDVRNTINEIFFGRGERGSEPGTPLNPLFSDLAKTRQGHEDALDSLYASLSPADLVDSQAPSQQQAETAQVSPADLVDSTGPVAQQHDQQQRQSHGLSM